jgi:hypothetical protein
LTVLIFSKTRIKTKAKVKGKSQLIKKAKGIKPYSLSLSDYETMYYKSNSVFGTKISTISDIKEGSVLINKNKTLINWNSYKKGVKRYDPKTSLWIGTEPLYINTLDKNILFIYTSKYNKIRALAERVAANPNHMHPH